MAKKRTPETTAELLRVIERFTDDPCDLTNEELQTELREMSIDPDALVARVQGLVDSSVTKARLAWKTKARKERQSLLRHLEAVEPDAPSQNMKAEIESILTSLSEGAVPGVQAYWRKFEKATESDLQSLLEDLKRLEKLRELRKEDTDET